MQHQIEFGSRTIVYNLEYRARKSIGIKVYPDTRIEVFAPLEAKEEHVIEKVKLKAPWILKQIDQFNAYKPEIPPRRYINGETHLYLGRQYRLKIVPNERNAVKVYRGQMVLYSQNTNPELLKIQLDDWYRQKASVVYSELLEETLPKFRRYNISEPILILRKMNKRWGSCTSTGKIILNTELIKAPKGCIEYVLIHELCHLIHRNHTKAFQMIQSEMLPEWRMWKERLEYILL